MQHAIQLGHAGLIALAREAAMPPSLPAPCFEIDDVRAGRFVCYAESGPSAGSSEPPLLLVHSINAAGSAYEMKPLFDHYRGKRAVYALDLPGFGLSDRSKRDYTPRLMTDAILAVAGEIARRHDGMRIDMVALSLGCEFAARAAIEQPNSFASLALISPTGFDRRTERAARQSPRQDRTRAMPWLRATLSFPLWKSGFFRALTSRASIRFFLRKTFGSRDVDEALVEFDYLTTHQPGAENAPYCFVAGYLFTVDAMNIYRTLAMPVWMVHGVRGDFVDYGRKGLVRNLPNWSFDVMQTGAMPHFEQPAQFVAAYENFLRRARMQ